MIRRCYGHITVLQTFGRSARAPRFRIFVVAAIAVAAASTAADVMPLRDSETAL